MQHFFKSSLFLVTLVFTPLSAEKLDFSSLVNEFMEEGNVLKTTINLSGKQRMLTQRMSKLALQVDLNIQKKKSSAELKKMAALYDMTLKAFSNGNSDLGIKKANNKKVLAQIAVLEKAWKPFHEHVTKIVEGKDDGKSLQYLIANNEKLLSLSDDLVKAYEFSNSSSNYLEKARLRVVNIAGRQRMLTQKMTKEKLLLLKGEHAYSDKLKKTIKLFDSSLISIVKGDKSLKITKPTNEKIIKQLKVVSEMWTTLKPLYKKEKSVPKELAIIISKNKELLNEMNAMVQLAEKEAEY